MDTPATRSADKEDGKLYLLGINEHQINLSPITTQPVPDLTFVGRVSDLKWRSNCNGSELLSSLYKDQSSSKLIYYSEGLSVFVHFRWIKH